MMINRVNWNGWCIGTLAHFGIDLGGDGGSVFRANLVELFKSRALWLKKLVKFSLFRRKKTALVVYSK
jgi:hypothetical protein